MDIVRGELVEKQLDSLIERRSRNGELDPDEREELWKESVRAYDLIFAPNSTPSISRVMCLDARCNGLRPRVVVR